MWALLALMNLLLFCQMQQHNPERESLKPSREGAISRSLAALTARVQGCPCNPTLQQEGSPKGSPQHFAGRWGTGHAAPLRLQLLSQGPRMGEAAISPPLLVPGASSLSQAAGRQNAL